MPNKHFCQGPDCHERTTQDRFLKSRGVIRGRYALWTIDNSNEYAPRAKFFCSTGCESRWLDVHMENIEQARPIEFIRHRRESGGYAKVTEEHYGRNYNTIKRVDNRTEIE
tara:strand:- start:113 stop:445 length:333 start_codon:yes stop_codon:yes gene_type:complete